MTQPKKPTIETGLFGQRTFDANTAKQSRMDFDTESKLSEQTERKRSTAAEIEGQAVFDEPISSYSASEALEDGLFVEASPETHPGALFTRSVYDRIIEREGWTWEDDELSCTPLEYRQRVVPLLMDAAMIIQGRPDDHLWTEGLEGNLTGSTLGIARNDLGGFTIMFPEDY